MSRTSASYSERVFNRMHAPARTEERWTKICMSRPTVAARLDQRRYHPAARRSTSHQPSNMNNRRNWTPPSSSSPDHMRTRNGALSERDRDHPCTSHAGAVLAPAVTSAFKLAISASSHESTHLRRRQPRRSCSQRHWSRCATCGKRGHRDTTCSDFSTWQKLPKGLEAIL